MTERRVRNYCFTVNNYTSEDISKLEACYNIGRFKYLIIGKEVGEESGIPHLQGYIHQHCPSSLMALKNAIGINHMHLEIANTVAAGIDYCKKEGDYTEYGQRPLTKSQICAKGGQALHNKWTKARKLAEVGNFDEIDDDIYIRHGKMLKTIHEDKIGKKEYVTLDHPDKTMLWYYGPPGTGKSKTARQNHPELYLKMCNKWWQNYKNEKVVLLEDMGKEHNVLAHHLKIWADRYPFPAETKGNAITARPELIIVTSNYTIDEIFNETDAAALHRRFKTVHFNEI